MHEISIRKLQMQQDTVAKQQAAKKKAKDDGDEEYTVSSSKRHPAGISAKKRAEMQEKTANVRLTGEQQQELQ